MSQNFLEGRALIRLVIGLTVINNIALVHTQPSTIKGAAVLETFSRASESLFKNSFPLFSILSLHSSKL